MFSRYGTPHGEQSAAARLINRKCDLSPELDLSWFGAPSIKIDRAETPEIRRDSRATPTLRNSNSGLRITFQTYGKVGIKTLFATAATMRFSPPLSRETRKTAAPSGADPRCRSL